MKKAEKLERIAHLLIEQTPGQHDGEDDMDGTYSWPESEAKAILKNLPEIVRIASS